MIEVPNGPAVLYITADSDVVRLDDTDDLTQLAPRELAIISALLAHSLGRLKKADGEIARLRDEIARLRADLPGEAL